MVHHKLGISLTGRMVMGTITAHTHWVVCGLSSIKLSVGQPVSAELPNITGVATPVIWNDQTTSSGGFYQMGPTSTAGVVAGSSLGTGGVYFNASGCSSIYKDSATTVVPESLKVGWYIKF